MTDTVRVCLALSSVQVVAGNSDAAIDAVRGTFTSFLTGPSEKRNASTDGEDVLTPLVEHASESIVTAIKGGK